MSDHERTGEPIPAPIFEASAAAEVHDELEFHIEMRTRDLIAKGVSPADANRLARERFGDLSQVTRECRTFAERRDERERRTRYFTNLVQDIHFALRTFRRRPAFALLAVLTTALGIGAATAIYSVIDGVMLRPLPFNDAGKLVAIWNTDERFHQDATLKTMWDRIVLGREEYDVLRERSKTLHDVALWSGTSVLLRTERGQEQLGAVIATSNLLGTLQLQPALGRAFLPGEDVLNGPHVAMVSWEAWQSRWHGDSSLLGRSLVLENEPYTVVGVLPRGLRMNRAAPIAAVWLPAFRDSSDLPERHNRNYQALARLAANATAEQATVEASRLLQQEATAHRGANAAQGVAARVEGWQVDQTRTVRASLWILFGAVVLLMLVACVNVATLMLGEAARREPEMSARIALGASPSRIALQLLTEGVAISVIGAAAGCVLAAAGVALLVRMAPARLPGIADVHVDGRVLLFAALSALATGVLFGLAPAVVAARRGARSSVRIGAGQTQRGMRRVQRALVATEVALSLVLLVGCTLLGRSLLQLTRTSPGFDTRNLSVVQFVQQRSCWKVEEECRVFYDNAVRELSAIPGVESVTGATSAPFAGGSSSSPVKSDGREYGESGGSNAQQRSILPNYFSALGIRLLAGRAFTGNDVKGSEPVIIVSEAEARRDWPNATPVGRRLFWQGQWRTVVGIVGDVKYAQLSRDNEPTVYVPAAQHPNDLVLIVRTARPIRDVTGVLRRRLAPLDASVSVLSVEEIGTLIGRSYGEERYRALLASLFGLLAGVLAVVGIFGVASRAVARRMRESGIRAALGASTNALTFLLMRETLAGIAMGLAVGLPAALLVGRVMKPYLFGVAPSDPLTFVVTVVVLAVAGVAATLRPAQRAGRVNPVVVLRAE